MATIPKSAVTQAFLTDHRKFMRLLRDVCQALNQGETEFARTLARELNHVAGPHIAFEETVLYPLLNEKSDETFVEVLYQEHQTVVAALQKLLGSEHLTASELTEIQQAFTEGLSHAEHCGTLISSLAAMDDVDQREALDELQQLRASDITWTQLKKA